MRPHTSVLRLISPARLPGAPRLLVMGTATLLVTAACSSRGSSDGAGGEKSAPEAAPASQPTSAAAPYKPMSKEDGLSLLEEEKPALELPTPSDLLNAISHLEAGGKPVRLDRHIAKAPEGAKPEVESQAFLAGTLITDFLIYAQAQDKDACLRTAKALRGTVEHLKLEAKFEEPEKQLEAALGKGDWDEVRGKMDEIFETFKSGRDESADARKVAAVLTASAWMESIFVLSRHLSKDYSEPASKLLRQGFIGQSLEEELASVSVSGFGKNLLPAMKVLVEATSVDREAPVSKEAVAKISTTIAGLRAKLEG